VSAVAFLKRVTLTKWLLLAIVAGVLAGEFFPRQAEQLQFVFNIFLRLIKCVVAPLVFSLLVTGIASHADDLKAVGRMALKSLVYFEIVTTLALLIGMAAANAFHPGNNIHLAPSAAPAAASPSAEITLSATLERAVPQSFFYAAARNDVLQVAVFAVLFGISLAYVKPAPRQTMLNFCDALAQVMFQFTGLVMWLAPLAVGAAVAWTIAKNGFATILSLGQLVLTLYGALLAFVVFVFLPVLWLARIPVAPFFQAIRSPALLAFSTASSEAAMPEALLRLEQFGVPKRIASFVLPAGYSFNLDGTALYLAVVVIFIAQAAGIHMTFAQQLPILLTLMLASKGAAGVPRAAMAVLAGTLASFGLPAEGLVVILGVDACLDMGRTAVNLTGNCLAAVVVARWEGELPPASGLATKAAEK
jgi:proton glutamate symport protein